MANKYMRALPYSLVVNSANVINENAFTLKMMYEFWGYCVNSPATLTTPAGFAPVGYSGGGLPPTFLEGNPATTSVIATTTNSAANLTFPLSGTSITVPSSIGINTGPGFLLINGSQAVSYTGTNGTTIIFGVTGGTPSTTSVGSQPLPASNFNVTSTNGWPTTGGEFIVSGQIVTYTGISGNTFTGCSGGTGTISNGTTTSYYVPIGSPIAQIPLSTYTLLNVGTTTGFPVFGSLTVGAVTGAQTLAYTSLGGASTTISGGQTLPESTVTVLSTTGFPATGTFTVLSNMGYQTVTYSGLTAGTFTGCTGGLGTVVNGATVADYSYFNGVTGGTSTTTTTGAIAIVSSTFTLPISNIPVISTNGFPSSGTFTVFSTIGTETITYTGTSGGNTFTGCTGGTGTVTIGANCTSTASQALPAATINVLNTAAFPSTGQILVQTSIANTYQLVSYTGTTGYSFIGCTQLSGAGTSSVGSSVTLVNAPAATVVDGYINQVTGVDGSTVAGSSVFATTSTSPFNASMINKYLTTWIPGSGSSDDCVYQITAVPSSNELIINPNNGGTPSNTTLHPTFTTRTGIHYRVVDIAAASQIQGVAPGNFLVFQYACSNVNTGAASSQIQMFLRQGNPPYTGTSLQTYGWVVSPSGSWTGTAFTGTPSTTTVGSQTVPSAPTTFTLNVNSTLGFPGFGTLNVGGTNVLFTGITPTTFTGCTIITGTTINPGTSVTMIGYNDTFTEVNTNNGLFFNGQGASSGFISMVADTDFFLMHVKSTNAGGSGVNAGSIIHIETPYRLYPQANDPNPFTMMADAGEGFSSNGNLSSGQYYNYAGGFWMIGTDFTIRKHSVNVKSLAGDGNTNAGVTPSSVIPGDGFATFFTGFNVYNGTAISSECTLSTYTTATQFCYARCKLKNIRIAGTYIPSYHKIGNNGQFLHLTTGVCWPWDNTILPYNLMPGGF